MRKPLMGWLWLKKTTCYSSSGSRCFGPITKEISHQTTLILGPNGSGKTLLGRVISGLSPTLYDGLQVTNPPSHNFGPVQPHNPIVFSYFPQAWELLFIGSTISTDIEIISRRLDIEQVQLLNGINFMGVDPIELRTRAPTSFSSGEQQRIGLGFILGIKPKAAYLDEPDAFLDELGLSCLASFIKCLSDDGVKLLIATHSPDLYENLPSLSLSSNKKTRSIESLRIKSLLSAGPFQGNSKVTIIKKKIIPMGIHKRLLIESLTLRRGERIIVFGENGSGKTTLLTWLCKEMQSRSKRARNISEQPPSIMITADPYDQLRLGSIEEEFKLIGFTRKTIEEWINLFIAFIGGWETPVYRLSWGHKRLLTILLGIIKYPQLLLIDESLAGLDPESAEIAQSLVIHAASRGCCVVVTTNRKSTLWQDSASQYSIYKQDNLSLLVKRDNK